MNIKNYTTITTNSKKVINNSIFVSVNNDKSHIQEAINNGASLIVSTEKIDIKINSLIVKNIKYFRCLRHLCKISC